MKREIQIIRTISMQYSSVADVFYHTEKNIFSIIPSLLRLGIFLLNF